MRRRTFTAGVLALAAVPGGAGAQGRRPLVAIMVGATEASARRYTEGFTTGMRELGYVDGQNVDLTWRFAEGDLSRLPALTEEIVRLRPAVLVASNTGAGLAAKATTSTIPIVVPAMTDPVGFGLVASYARPGGNVTGLLSYVDTLPGKLLQIAAEVVPTARRVAILLNDSSQISGTFRHDAEAAASVLKLELVPCQVRTAGELEAAVGTMARAGLGLAYVTPDPMFLSERRRIAALMAAARLPCIYAYREHTEDGGLMSYGIDLRESFRRAAALTDKVLKGAEPGDMPLALPSTFELVLNMKVANALALTFPLTLLAQANEVIEP